MASIQTDLRAIETIGGALAGSDRPFVIASGSLGVAPGRVATEELPFNPQIHPRAANAAAALGLAQRGVRVSLMRLAPTVHGKGDHGFVPELIRVAREKRVSGFIGDGTNHWNAVHRLDAARLFRLALEKAPPSAVLHAVADEAVPARQIAEVIGRKLGVPAASIAPEAAGAHFGWIARFFAMDQPASSAITRRQMGWTPTHPSLFEDLEAGHYFDAAGA